MPNSVHFNGTTYSSIDDMPADVRRMYAQVRGVFTDKNQDSVPDAFERLVNPGSAMPLVQGQTTIMYNGQVYHSLDQMPPEARAKHEQYQAQFDANRNGMPDALEGYSGAMMPLAAAPTSPAKAANAPAFAASAPIAPRAPSPYNQAAGSVVSAEGGDLRLKLAILALVGLGAMVCVLVAVVVWALAR